MSSFENKAKSATRRYRDETAVKKQLKIAKAHGLNLTDKMVKEPHRLAKHHAMDCGNPECYICGNPRKSHKDKLTPQEHRLYQDLENVRDKKSNGLINKDESEE